MRRILFMIPHDFSSVRGAAEPYYVYHFFSKRYKTILIVPIKPTSATKLPGEIHAIPPKRQGFWKFLPFWLYCDLHALKIARKLPLERDDSVWTYRGFIITPLWLRLRHGCHWIVDFRAPPVEQNLEFYRVRGRLNLRRKLYYLAMKLVYRWVLAFADKVIVVSPMLRDMLVKDYGAPLGKVYIQPLGVDLDLFKKRSSRRFHETEPRVVYLTSIARQRGVDCAIHALRLLQEHKLRPQLLLVGTGPKEDLQWIRDLAEREGVKDQVRFLGPVPHEQVPQILEECDIGLSPLPDLLSYRVSSPTKVFEYLAMGLVVIASDLPAHRVIIQDGENGLLAPPDKPEAWAEAIAKVCWDEDLRKKLQNRARESAKRYDWDYMLTHLGKTLFRDQRDGQAH